MRLQFMGAARPWRKWSRPLVLLAYLAAEGPTEAWQLAERFWPDARDARASLRDAVRRLRRDYKIPIEHDGGVLANPVPSDVRTILEGHARQRCGLIIENYGGPFLYGLELPQYPSEVQEWVLTTRAHLEELCREAHAQLALAAARAKREPWALEHLLALENLLATVPVEERHVLPDGVFPVVRSEGVPVPGPAPQVLDTPVFRAVLNHAWGSVQELMLKDGRGSSVLDPYWTVHHAQGLGRLADCDCRLVAWHVGVHAAVLAYKSPKHGRKFLTFRWAAGQGVEIDLTFDLHTGGAHGNTFRPAGAKRKTGQYVVLLREDEVPVVAPLTYPGAYHNLWRAPSVGGALWDDHAAAACGFRHAPLDTQMGEGDAADGPCQVIPAGVTLVRFALKPKEAFWRWFGVDPTRVLEVPMSGVGRELAGRHVA